MTNPISARLREGMINLPSDIIVYDYAEVEKRMTEAADHIDAQDAKIKALVDLIGDYWTGNHFTGVSIYDAERITSALAATKGTYQ